MLMRRSGLFDLVAAYDRNPAALAQCEAEDGAKPVGSYEELLDAPGIEAVIISTGASSHAGLMLQAMKRGLHVFVEKPLCSTAHEVRALLEAQQRAGVVVAMGHKDHRHDAVARTIKDLLHRGELGEVAAFEKTTAHNGGLQIKSGDWRGDPDKNPGGMLFQCGVHALHELMYYFGPVSEVSCMMRYDVHTTGTADAAICNLKFASGLIGTLTAYHVTPYCHTFRIFGTKANLYRDERYFDEGTQIQIQRTKLNNAKEPKETVPQMGETDECGGLRSFYHAIREGGEPRLRCTTGLAR